MLKSATELPELVKTPGSENNDFCGEVDLGVDFSPSFDFCLSNQEQIIITKSRIPKSNILNN